MQARNDRIDTMEPRGLSRREFVCRAGLGAAALGLGGLLGPLSLPRSRAWAAQEVKLAPLPYPEDALEPFISERTVRLHHGKHQAGYVKKTNELVQGTPLAGASLVEIVRKAAADEGRRKVFDNAAQVYNHQQYWLSMKPGGSQPNGALADAIRKQYEKLEKLKEQIVQVALERFGSGWVWLLQEKGKLLVQSTPNAETPITRGVQPLLTLDVWEHAYYLDYQNRRADYAKAWVDRLVNWDFASANLAAALKEG